MFQEDCCLQCGKPVAVDGRIYCSDECQSLDSTSPSISTPSSAFSSPNLKGYQTPATADVPPLFPAALGVALNASKPRPDRYSSSKSSLMWYDDDDSDSPAIAVDDEHANELTIPIRHQGLSYARRPSSTNNRSTVPLLHRHHSSISGGHSPTSAIGSSFSSAADDAYASNPYLQPPSQFLHPSSPSKPHTHHSHSRPSHHRLGSHDSKTTTDVTQDTVTAKRKRNRASLPAHFSLLTLSSPPIRPSTSNTSASYTTMRPSPTTPRISDPTVDSTHAIALSSSSYTSAPQPSSLLASIHTTRVTSDANANATPDPPRGRGRRREPGTSRHRTSSRSDSSSPSRDRDRDYWARKTVSPPVRRHAPEAETDGRGRRRMDELDGWEGDMEFGFGGGRSGLVERQREKERGRGRDR